MSLRDPHTGRDLTAPRHLGGSRERQPPTRTTLRYTTRVRGYDNRIITVPNSDIAATTTINYSRMRHRPR